MADINFNGFLDEGELALLVEMSGGLVDYGFESFGEEVLTSTLLVNVHYELDSYTFTMFIEDDEFIHYVFYGSHTENVIGYYFKIN